MRRPTACAHVRDRASDMVVSAMTFLGVPYRRGGNGADGFDCSGFTRHVFQNTLGLVLPRRADEQATAAGLVQVQRDELKPGDLVFFNTLKRTFSHVGIYIGEGKFIHFAAHRWPGSGGRHAHRLLVAALHRRPPGTAGASRRQSLTLGPDGRAARRHNPGHGRNHHSAG